MCVCVCVWRVELSRPQATRGTDTLRVFIDGAPLFERRAVTFSERTPTTNPFLTNGKKNPRSTPAQKTT